MAQGKTTTDHEEIRRWAEQRGGVPASVRGTGRGKRDETGILRLDFEPRDEELEEISWDEFFDKFEEADLAFLYQEETAAGKTSRFHKFVSRPEGEERAAAAKSRGKGKAGAANSEEATARAGRDKAAGSDDAPARTTKAAASKTRGKAEAKTGGKAAARTQETAKSGKDSKSKAADEKASGKAKPSAPGRDAKASGGSSGGQTTVDHDAIRQWAEERGGVPASVKGTERGKNDEAGILRLDFEPRDEKLEEISWEEFFEKFEEAKLAFLYQAQTAKGEVSRFHKFISRPAGKTQSGGRAKAGSGKKTAGGGKSRGR
jgi:hypothetical protein